MQITPELVNFNLEQINYLIDLVSKDIQIEKTAYEEGYDPYQRKGCDGGPATKKQCQIHNAKAMQQHLVMKQLYVIAQYSIESEAEMSPENFSKPGSEVEPTLCDETGRPL
jgi:hypothetical protein